MTLDELLARESIRYTLSVYNNAGDRGQIDEMAGTFREDAVLEFPDGAVLRGRSDIADYLRSLVTDRRNAAPARQNQLLRHHLTTSRIELLSATEAQAWSYVFVVTDDGPDHSGGYNDRFVQTGDRWLIQRRRLKIDWASETSWFRDNVRAPQ